MSNYEEDEPLGSDTRYQRDIKIIEAATAGPWFKVGGNIYRRPKEDLYEFGGGVAGDKPVFTANIGWPDAGLKGYPVSDNAVFIAHFNPEYVRELVESLRSSHKESEILREHIARISEAQEASDWALMGVSIREARELLK